MDNYQFPSVLGSPFIRLPELASPLRTPTYIPFLHSSSPAAALMSPLLGMRSPYYPSPSLIGPLGDSPLSRVLFSPFSGINRISPLPTIPIPLQILSDPLPDAGPQPSNTPQPSSTAEFTLETSTRGKPIVVIGTYRLHFKKINEKGTVLFKCRQRKTGERTTLCGASVTLSRDHSKIVRAVLCHNH